MVPMYGCKHVSWPLAIILTKSLACQATYCCLGIMVHLKTLKMSMDKLGKKRCIWQTFVSPRSQRTMMKRLNQMYLLSSSGFETIAQYASRKCFKSKLYLHTLPHSRPLIIAAVSGRPSASIPLSKPSMISTSSRAARANWHAPSLMECCSKICIAHS